MAVSAITRNFGMSPKKVRRVLDLIRGKKAEQALATLRFMPSPAAEAVAKTLKSAMANAENNNMLAPEDLKVLGAYADDGPRLRRFRPQSRGRINRIVRRFSHITVSVGEEVPRNGA